MSALQVHQISSGFQYRKAVGGLSLIELGLVMAIVSLALVPVVQMLSGARSQTGEGSVDRITAMKSKEAILANTLVEGILAGDFSKFDCDTSGNPRTFNTATDLPASGASKTYSMCTDNTYNKPLYYQWSVVSVSGMPQQNQYYQGTFNIYDKPANGQALLTLPANFFMNGGAFTQPTEKIGIMFAMDVSGSMAWAQTPSGISAEGGSGMSSPYMFYRYDRNRFTGNTWGVAFSPATVPGMVAGTKRAWLNMWNNNELDMSYAQSIKAGTPPDFTDPDLTTENNEVFPYSLPNMNDPTWGKGLLGTGHCGSSSPANWNTDVNLIHTFVPGARTSATYRSLAQALCDWKTSSAAWGTALNTDMSRLEAVRTGALALMLSLENNSSVVPYLELGFIPWSDAPQPQHLVAMAPAVAVAGVPGVHFSALRQKLLWINRADPSNPASALPIKAKNGTAMHAGLEAARVQVMSKNYDRRIIILFTDGAPSDYTPAQLQTYVLNTFGNNAPKSQQVTLYTVGLIGADPVLMANLANSTPDGQSYTTNDLRQLHSIFDSIAYQIQKLTLMNVSQRYGLNF
jgi:hypothetical protein